MLSEYEKTIRRSLSKNEDAIRYAEIMVREAGYNYQMLIETRGATLLRGGSKLDHAHDHETAISRSFGLYENSKWVLRALDPDNAETFIKSTYGYGIKFNG